MTPLQLTGADYNLLIHLKLKEKDYWLCFNICGGFGPKRFAVVLKHFGSAEKAWAADKGEWQKLRLPLMLIERFFSFREGFDLVSYKVRLERHLITCVNLEDNNYPINLKKIDSPPYILYIKGRLLPQDALAISIVGTRKVSGYGREVTERLVGSLVCHSLTIVSGLARGVDSLSHRVTLEFGGRTIAVVGHGLEMIYPPENKPLADEIINSGAIISQFPLDIRSVPGNFPCRNRVIAGLSLGTVVVEGTSDSGSLITAGYSRECNRPVFAVPGPITSPLSAAPSNLIKAGAKLVTCGEDILQELKLKFPAFALEASHRLIQPCSPRDATAGKQNLKFANPSEEKIWQVLVGGIKHLDEISRESQLAVGEVCSTLTKLELQGTVKNLGNGEYCL